MAIKTKMKDMAPSRQKLKQTIKLISGGYAAPEIFPGGDITVYPWDNGIDRWLTEKGRTPASVYDLVGQLADLKGCPIDKFVLGDVSTILLVSRAIARDNIVEIRPVCPHCRLTMPREQLRVPDELEKIGEKSSNYPGFDSIVLPACLDEVKIRPLLVGDEKIILARSDEQRKTVTDFLARVLTAVVSINDTIPDTLTELVGWWNALHPKDQQFIQSQQDRLYPHLNTDVNYTCDGCLREFTHTMTFDQEFFR